MEKMTGTSIDANLQNIAKVCELIELEDAKFVTFNKSYFIISGKLDQPGVLKKNETFDMSFINNINGNKYAII